jgi:hypothetical protein
MSFKIKVSHLNNKNFVGTVKKLTAHKLPFNDSWHLKGLVTKLDAAMDHTASLYSDIIKDNAVLDEKGNLVPMKAKEDIKAPDGSVYMKEGTEIPNSYTPKEEDSAAKIESQTAELMDTELDIDHTKVNVKALSNVEISAEELELLEPILHIPEEIRDNVIPMK